MKGNSILKILLILLIIVLSVLLTLVVVYINNDDTKNNNIFGEIIDRIDIDPEEYFTDIANNANGKKLKTGFVNAIDFIFYNKKINNITFDELKDSAKLKIIKLTYKIDSKIDSLFPGYKETIKSTVSRIYTSVKERLTKLYLSITNKICEATPSTCKHAKEDFLELKEDFGLTFDFLKNLFDQGKDSFNEWYYNN